MGARKEAEGVGALNTQSPASLYSRWPAVPGGFKARKGLRVPTSHLGHMTRNVSCCTCSHNFGPYLYFGAPLSESNTLPVGRPSCPARQGQAPKLRGISTCTTASFSVGNTSNPPPPTPSHNPPYFQTTEKPTKKAGKPDPLRLGKKTPHFRWTGAGPPGCAGMGSGRQKDEFAEFFGSSRAHSEESRRRAMNTLKIPPLPGRGPGATKHHRSIKMSKNTVMLQR